MNKNRIAMAVAIAFPLALPAIALAQSNTPMETGAPVKSLGVVTVTGGAPTSLPTQIPTTIEGVTREQIEQSVNATDSEDALKYFPSLLVRKRYIGDYNHAVLSSRASGTGNSARSAVYADGILLSNYLGNGATYAPRWGLVTPEEIERADVMYGPFSAAYPGNSVGAVVDYVTRMPTKFEGHAKISLISQPFSLYSTNETYSGNQASASLGSKSGDWSWFANLNHTDSHGQPLTFPTRLLSARSNGKTQATGTGTPKVVTGALLDANNANGPIYILGTGTEYHTLQDHAKIKLAYDINPTLRASYTFGLWQNTSEGRPVSYLKDSNGNPVYSGPIVINGSSFYNSTPSNATSNQTLTGGDFPLTNESVTHTIHGLSVKSHTQGEWDWEAAASLYSYDKNILRQNGSTNPLPTALTGGAGTITDGNGTGWNTLALKGIWRPQGISGAHIVDFGYQQDSYKLHSLVSNTSNWIAGDPTTLSNEIGGNTSLRSLYGQDSWTFDAKWKTVLGARLENWTADNGFTTFGVGNAANAKYASRSEDFISPKAALSYQWADDLVVKGSIGRAIRMPTVSELYGATSTTNSKYINDPNLRPEKSWTTEFTAEKDLGNSLLRLTYFVEDVKDSLYSQNISDPAAANATVSRVQNVGRILTNGLEVAFNGENIFAKGLDLSGSVTYTDSQIMENDGFVAVAGDTIGKRQPNIPAWRATALASYRVDEHWSTTLGARYSGPQFRTLNNADVNGYTYQGVSEFFTTDVRVRYVEGKRWSASFGIDNLNNYQYWNFHPYPNRSYVFELKCDI